jgi:perosamine synthetase
MSFCQAFPFCFREEDANSMPSTYQAALLPSQSTLAEALHNMNQSGLRAALVVDADERLQGLITDFDIRQAMAHQIPLETPVENVMNTQPRLASAGRPYTEYRDLMLKYHNDCLPIVDADGRVADLVLLTDFIRRIPLSEPTLEANVWTYVKDALDTGWVSSVGPYVDQFESRMAEYFDVSRTVATASGTAALHIALLLAGVGPGDEVIVPSLTFIASINAIRYVGATPVFWDSQATHWNADPTILDVLVTPKTKAIMVVHLYGTPVEMAPVLKIAQRHGIKIIEDAAEALGASWQGRPCGSIGDIGCLSFNGNKVMTTGSGGLIISANPELMARAHYLVNQAKDDALTFSHDEVGYNYRMTNLHAALGVAQLESLPGFLAHKREIAARYTAAFQNNPSLHPITEPVGTKSSYWLAAIALNPMMHPDKTALDLVKALAPFQIDARPFFKPGHLQKSFLLFVPHTLPQAENWQRVGINLPSSPSLKPQDQETVIKTIEGILTQWRLETSNKGQSTPVSIATASVSHS